MKTQGEDMSGSQPPRAGWRVAVTVAVLLLCGVSVRVVSIVQGPLQGTLAVRQVEDDPVDYSVGRAATVVDIPAAIEVVSLIIVAAVWIPFVWKHVTKRHLLQVLAACLLTGLVSGCGPAYKERFVEIGPNETAFLIPLEGDSIAGQGALDSVGYLEKAMVVSKRVTIPQKRHYFGYLPQTYRWIAEVLVIKVDRAPITREWTADPTTGTSPANQALEVESLDSINFSIGATITCRIEEKDTPTFLYYFGTQADEQGAEDGVELVYCGRALSDIVDTNIRSHCQARLAALFGSVDLNEGKEKKADFFEQAFEETQQYFKERGITIDSFGSAKGLFYHNPEIQEAINRRFVTENSIEVARQELAAQKNRNATKVAKASAERRAAEAFLAEKEAMLMTYRLELNQLRAEARQTMAQRWDGQMPTNLLPAGRDASGLLLQVD
jgi:hypothetical protein